MGSLWTVQDDYSATVAMDVYAWILEVGLQVGLDAGGSAEGLHKAVRGPRDRIRIKRKHDPFVWAPLIHVGI